LTFWKSALAAAALLAPATAQAVTYDAFASFNGTNGAGHFFYSQTPVTPGPGSPLTPGGAGCVIAGSICLQAAAGLPGAYKSTTASAQGSVLVPDDRLLFHPGPAQNVLVTFVAPSAGNYLVNLALSVQDTNPSGVNIFSFNNEGGVVSGGPLTTLGAGNLSQSFARSIYLNAGQYIGMGINPGTSYNNDSIGVKLTISDVVASVPEPAQWALLIGGFALVGASARRRRTGTVTTVTA
jgi:hypothetical protein